jgi:hypothetical protein
LTIAQDNAVTMTAACDVLGRHQGQGPAACKGTVLSLTGSHGRPCGCPCHDPAPVDPDQELEDLLEREADAHLWDWSL